MTSTAKYKFIVKNLPLSVSTKELTAYFCRFGQIHSAEVIFDDKTGFSKGYGNVNYTRHLNINEMDQPHKIHGEIVNVTRIL